MNSFVYKKSVPESFLKYWKKEKLDRFIKLTPKKIEYEPFFNVKKQQSVPFPPEIEDLVNLHQLIRKRKAFTVLEFGVGFSSIVIADALLKNKNDFEKLKSKPKIRKENLFELHSLDASKFWINAFKKKIPNDFKKIIKLYFSEVEISKFNNQICHFYKKLPNIVPDFIYLDGPAAYDVKGQINGINFDKMERTVMSADLLSIEPFFIPGIFILIDGRTNNARFLKNNLQRKYRYKHNTVLDNHEFELIEPPLGIYNKRMLNYCKLNHR
tara:strand:+ start:185 stop:991 length:807 start_codon:yes stop_codon:yes gene_type:complete